MAEDGEGYASPVRSPRPYSPQAGPGAQSLTERRKAATQLDIARAACELFAEHGPDGTTAEDIAHRAGVALRTFYRYFRNKQEAVAPLLAGGVTPGAPCSPRRTPARRWARRWNARSPGP